MAASSSGTAQECLASLPCLEPSVSAARFCSKSELFVHFGPPCFSLKLFGRSGDGYLKPFVTAEPEVTVTERTDDDECLILASDGLWDVVTNEMACDVVRACFRSNGPPSPPGARPNGVLPPSAAGAGREGDDGAAAVKGVDKADSDKACSDAALLLAKLALARRSTDNVSVVVVDLRRRC